jgi:hypothetical protein
MTLDIVEDLRAPALSIREVTALRGEVEPELLRKQGRTHTPVDKIGKGNGFLGEVKGESGWR